MGADVDRLAGHCMLISPAALHGLIGGGGGGDGVCMQTLYFEWSIAGDKFLQSDQFNMSGFQ